MRNDENQKGRQKNIKTHERKTLYAQFSVFKHRKILKKGAAAVTTVPGQKFT